MRLIDAVGVAGTRAVVPLMGYPGVRATGHTAREALTDVATHVESVLFLERRYNPPCIFHVMDLTVEAEALGLPVVFEGDGPPSVAGHTVSRPADISALAVPDPLRDGRMPLLLEVVRKMSDEVSGLVGAYAIGPFTLAAELCGAEELAVRTITDRGFAESLIGFSTLVVERYARALAGAGAGVVAFLEPTSVILSPGAFGDLCLEPLRRAASAARAGGAFPVLHICGDSTHLLDRMVACGLDGLSLDSPADLERAFDSAPADMLVIGNVDPVGVMVEGDTEAVRQAAAALLHDFGNRANFILGTGCDLPAETPLENIDALMSWSCA